MRKSKKTLLVLLALLSSFTLAATACGETEDNKPNDNPGIENPGDDPTDPGDDPTDPGDDPTDPGDDPTDPGDDPTDPEPSDPVSLGAEKVDAIPTSELTTVVTAGENTATANWFVEYGDTALEITAYVADTVLYTDGGLYGSDGIEVVISKTQRVEGYSEGTVSVVADLSGNMAVRNLYTEQAVEDSGVTATAKMLTIENKQFDGYYITLSVPYAATEVSFDAKDAAICFGLNNAADAMDLKFDYNKTYETDYNSVNTYVAVTSDNTFAVNPCYHLGMVWGDGGVGLQASDVWDISNDDGQADASIFSTASKQDNYIYMHSSDYTTAYMETKVNIRSLVAADGFVEQYRKFGVTMTAANGKTGFLFYVDAVSNGSADGMTINNDSVVLGYNLRVGAGDGAWGGNWTSCGNLGGTAAQYQGDEYVTFGIYRKGASFDLYANGKFVTTISDCGIGADEAAYFGLAAFNMTLNAKEYFVMTDVAEIEYYLLPERNVSLGEYDGVTAEFSKETAKAGDTVTFTLNTGDKILDTVKIGDNVLTADENGVYSFTMPDADVIVALTFKGLCTVSFDESVNGKIIASATSVYEGQTVTFRAADNWAISKIYANGVEIIPEDKNYSLTLTENVTITAEMFREYGGFVIDGKRDNGYGETNTVAEYTDNRDVTVYAYKASEGVLIYAVAHMNTMKTDAAEWYNNTNMEIWLNTIQHHVNINGDLGNVTAHYWITNAPEEAGEKYEYIVEAFIEKAMIRNWSDEGSVQLNYGWKTQGEEGVTVGSSIIHGYALDWKMDWFAGHGGGVNIGANDFPTGLGTFGTYSDKYQITANGLKIGEEAKEAVIDGDLSDKAYEGKTSETVGDVNKLQVTVTGFAGSDGLYLALTLKHKSWAELNAGHWASNDNLEIRINSDRSVPVLFLNGKFSMPDFFDRGAAKTVEVEGGLQTTVELFVNASFDSYKFQLGAAGNGFGGWQALLWDGNGRYITANGLVNANPEVAPATLDGVFDDAIWTEEVKKNVISADVRGAKVSVIGVNTKAGVMLGFTVAHTRPTSEACQGDGNAWWNYMGPEFRLAGMKDYQLAVTTWNNAAQGAARFGHKTVENAGEGLPYTTTYEVFVPHNEVCSGGISDPVELAIGGVFENGFDWLFGGNNANPRHLVTTTGIVAR